VEKRKRGQISLNKRKVPRPGRGIRARRTIEFWGYEEVSSLTAEGKIRKKKILSEIWESRNKGTNQGGTGPGHSNPGRKIQGPERKRGERRMQRTATLICGRQRESDKGYALISCFAHATRKTCGSLQRKGGRTYQLPPEYKWPPERAQGPPPLTLFSE